MSGYRAPRPSALHRRRTRSYERAASEHCEDRTIIAVRLDRGEAVELAEDQRDPPMVMGRVLARKVRAGGQTIDVYVVLRVEARARHRYGMPVSKFAGIVPIQVRTCRTCGHRSIDDQRPPVAGEAAK